MKASQNCTAYPTNWKMCFLCDCRKRSPNINIHQGIAHELSAQRVRLLSDHQICHKKQIALQLTIPSLRNGTPQKVVNIIGHTIGTIIQGGNFLTEIEFLQFEKDGQRILKDDLQQHFGSSL